MMMWTIIDTGFSLVILVWYSLHSRTHLLHIAANEDEVDAAETQLGNAYEDVHQSPHGA